MITIRKESCGVRKGTKFGSRKVIGHPFRLGDGKFAAVTRCRCGTVAVVLCFNLKGGGSQQCPSCTQVTHGDSRRSSEYRSLYLVWYQAVIRCSKTYSTRYNYYGGRGIAVCKQWLNYENFKRWALANGYKAGLTLDRRNNSKGYSPGNCRWATAKVQARNRRNNNIIVAFGEAKCLMAWTEDPRCKVGRNAITARIGRGWEPEDAITTPGTRGPSRGPC